MTEMMGIYTSAASATPAPLARSAQELRQTFAWLPVSSSSHRPEPSVSEELAAEIREALAAVERGETEDLGSFAQYADDED
jgi:hypothetical protein